MTTRTTFDFFSRFVGLVLGFLLCGAVALPSAAQPTWVEDTAGRPQVNLDWTKPSFESDAETSFLTSRLVLSGQYPIGNGTRLVAELPVTRFGISDEDEQLDGESSTNIGNPYLGVHRGFQSGWSVGGGVRLPLASPRDAGFEAPREDRVEAILDRSALQVGAISRIGRTEAFFPDVFTARGYGGYTVRSENGLSGRARTGLSVLAPTGDDDGRENLTLFDYSGKVFYDEDPVRVGVGVGGRTNVNGDEDESFGERTLTFLNASAQFQFESVRPGLTFRVPLDEQPSETLSYAIGFSVAVKL